MHFGKQLLARRYEPWADYYLDYNFLKNLVEQQPPAISSVPSTTSLSATARSTKSWHHRSVSPEFVSVLNVQVERAVHFFLQQQGALSSKLMQDLEPRLVSLTNNNVELELSEYMALYNDYEACAQTLLTLVQYVALNIQGVRKIIKKHDKITGLRLSNMYLKDDKQTRSVVLRPLLEDGGLEAIYVKLQTAFETLLEHQPDLQSEKHANAYLRWNTWSDDSGHDNTKVTSILAPVVEGRNRYASISVSERLGSNIKNEQRALFYSSHQLVLLQIQVARANLQESSDFVSMLGASALLEASQQDDDKSVLVTTESALEQRRRKMSNYLNFCSTFLHMTDYYIVAPTSGMYSERLGEAAALAGLIIGLNSVSALASTILYSWWTSYSYKSALIFASTCQMIGCLVYASALPMNSMTLVVVGRLIGGFGSARSINRRYIADTYPVHQRTAASAGFVTAGALGTSTGPALAALLYLAVPIDSANLYWQIENSPGWTMASLWTVYIVCLVFYFVEPPRKPRPTKSGLKLPGAGEKQALLDTKHNGASSKRDSHADPPLWKIVPVTTTFFVYFTLKFILESLLSSTAILTDYYFDWAGSASGIYLAILGLLVLPANWIITVASQRHEDRDLILAAEAFMLLGCIVILQFRET